MPLNGYSLLSASDPHRRIARAYAIGILNCGVSGMGMGRSHPCRTRIFEIANPASNRAPNRAARCESTQRVGATGIVRREVIRSVGECVRVP